MHKKALYPRARIRGLPPRGLGLEHLFVHGVERVSRVEPREHRAEVERPCGLHGIRERHEREVEPRKKIGVFQPRIQRRSIEQGRALVALHPIRPVLFGVLARVRTHHLIFPVGIAREYDARRMVGIGVCSKVERRCARRGCHQHVVARKHAAVFIRIGNKTNTDAIGRIELDDVERPAVRQIDAFRDVTEHTALRLARHVLEPHAPRRYAKLDRKRIRHKAPRTHFIRPMSFLRIIRQQSGNDPLSGRTTKPRTDTILGNESLKNANARLP